MTYMAHVKNGTIVLDEPVALPDGAAVKVEFAVVRSSDRELSATVDDFGHSFAERFSEVLGKARGLPEDAAQNHDHYLYGTTKR